MLTRGYLRGHLSFQYPQPLSPVRENYICSFLQNEATAEVFRTRALLDSSFVGLPTKQNMSDHMTDMFKSYVQITLPSRYQQDRIEDISKDKLKGLKDTLKAAKLFCKKLLK